jgi:hypothetical protein
MLERPKACGTNPLVKIYKIVMGNQQATLDKALE